MSRALVGGLRLLSSRLQKVHQVSPSLLFARKFPVSRKFTCSSYLASMSVEEKFTKEGVVPDVIKTPPSIAAKVVYPAGEVNFGNVMTPTQVQDPPKVSYPVEENALYTLIMTDPDAPSRADPEFREWRHWLVVNIPGCDIGKGEEVAAYIGSGPPQGTGLHRYVFLVYKQEGQITYSDPKLGLSVDHRGCTKANDVSAKYNLGNAVAGNFYQAEWDDYVPLLYKKLSSN